MIKKVVYGEELTKKMNKSINLLCDTVKSTLGPSGNNIIINESTLSPYITNDGVTIAENICSTDCVENTILQIAKEASVRTNDTVGDGTTTTLVLLQSIFNGGIKMIEEGYNPIKLKREIDYSATEIIKELEKLKRKFTNKDILSVATISSNDNNIGKLLSKVYKKTNLIKINESMNDKTDYEIVNGYSAETCVASNYFFDNKKEINMKNTYILITTDVIDSMRSLDNIICQLDKKDSLLIIAEDYCEEVVNELVMEKYQHTLNVTAIKLLQYGKMKYDILSDISVISGGTIFDKNIDKDIKCANISNLGVSKEIKITNDQTIIIDGKGDKKLISNLKENLKKEIIVCKDNYEKEFIKSRYAKLNNGIGIINVGASTITERREKKMRYEDALCALSCCKDGVLVGEGISLLKVQSLIKEKNIIDIVKSSLSAPFMQIMDNIGLNKEIMLESVKNNDYKIIYNMILNDFESIDITTIIDPFLVVKNEIISACSIAGMLLTTKYLVINEVNQDMFSGVKNEEL